VEVKQPRELLLEDTVPRAGGEPADIRRASAGDLHRDAGGEFRARHVHGSWDIHDDSVKS